MSVPGMIRGWSGGVEGAEGEPWLCLAILSLCPRLMQLAWGCPPLVSWMQLLVLVAIGKMVCMQKALRTELDDFSGSSASSPVPLNSRTSNGFSLALHAVEETKLLHQKKANSGTAAGSSLKRMGVFCPGWDLVTWGLWLQLLRLLLIPISHLARIHRDLYWSLLARIWTPHHRSLISCCRRAWVDFWMTGPMWRNQKMLGQNIR